MIKKIVITMFATLALMGGVSVATAVAAPSVSYVSEWTCPHCGKTYDVDPEDGLVELHLMFDHPEWWKSHFGDGTDDDD